MYNLSAFPEHLQKSLELFLKNNLITPKIVCSKNQIRHNIDQILSSIELERGDLFFPVKVNHDLETLKFINEQNTGFEIASSGELELLKKINAEPAKIIFSNPVKLASHIQNAYKYGVRTFAFDSMSELKKIHDFASSSNVYLRIAVSNSGAAWRLDNKFGAAPEEAIPLMKSAIDYGLKACGIAFHVGWNNTEKETYSSALSTAEKTIKLLLKNNIELSFLNIGGGFPAHCHDQYKWIGKISEKIKPQLNQFRDHYNLKIITEPGSFITANSAVMVCTVVETARRGKTNWIFLDSGIFQGFQWIMAGLKYQVIYPYKNTKKINLIKYTVTGPTCDSHDVFIKEILLPEAIKSGDKLMIYPAGAYIASAQYYNGFSYPETMIP